MKKALVILLVFCAVAFGVLFVMNQINLMKPDDTPQHTHTEGSPVIEKEVAATCTTDGSYDSVVYCTECKEEVSRETKTVNKLGHTPKEAVAENKIDATCEADGSYEAVVYCGTCNEEISRVPTVIESEGHDYASVVTAPTCTEAGYTTYTCGACGDSYVADETAATGHHFGTWEWVTESTYESAGVQKKACTCGEFKTREIAALTSGLAYSLNDDGLGYTVTGMGSNTNKDLVIPSYYQGPDDEKPLPVTAISDTAFDSVAITSVTILSGVKTIGQQSFCNFYTPSLKTVIIPDSVTSIGAYAFYAFSPKLESITVDDGNEYYKSVDGVLYTADGTTLVLYPSAKADTTLVIPDGVTTIGFASVIGSKNLTSIVIPTSLVSVVEEAFDGCTNLANVYYMGTEEEWANIEIDESYNSKFVNATKYYYSESEPTEAGNYWHYDVNGEIVVW